MSFSDNMFYIPNPLTTAANSLAEEATTSGGGKIEYTVPVNMDVEQFGVLIAVTLGNTITTATGFIFARVDAAGTETVLERLVLTNNSNGLYAGDGTNPGGATTAAATTAAFAPGTIILCKMHGTPHFPAGSLIRFRGSTTAGSATGDLVPFVTARCAGQDWLATNVYNEGALTVSRPQSN